jgi:quinol monooxygenase YgiN
MYSFIGKFTSHYGKRDELLAILTDAANNMGDIPGCHVYIINKDVADENAIWAYEVWDSKQAHDDSLKNENVRSIIARAMPLINGRPEGHELETVAGKGL